jgi:hypothetical protein
MTIIIAAIETMAAMVLLMVRITFVLDHLSDALLRPRRIGHDR